MWVLILIVILFLIFKPSKKAKRKKRNVKIVRQQRDLSRLAPDGELPVGWVYANRDFIEEAENELKYFYDEYYAHQYDEPKKKYAALKSLLLYFEDAKKIYAKKGECFLFWFENWWAKEEEIQRLQKELKYIEEHYGELELQYKKRQEKKKRIHP